MKETTLRGYLLMFSVLGVAAITACHDQPTPLEPRATSVLPQGLLVSGPNLPYTQVSAPNFHTCAIRSDGVVECWGNNLSGQAPPTKAAAIGTFTQLREGTGEYTCALRSDGVIECWGDNYYGQAPATKAAAIGTFTQVSGAYTHGCAVRSDGVIECWGTNADGQAPATKSATIGTFTQVGAGAAHTCALRSDGVIECWGSNPDGRAPATKSATVGTFTQVGAGRFHTCALRSDGVIECWGSNTAGQAPATKAAASGNFTRVGVGEFHTCSLRSDGVVECWGRNDYDQAPPTRPAAIGTFTQVTAANFNTCALRSDGAVECWGNGAFGQAPPIRNNQPYTGHIYPTATFSATPNPVPTGSSFTLALSNAQVPSWPGPVLFSYAFDCGDGSGYGVASTTASVACPTSTPGTRTAKGKVIDQSSDATEYTATVVVAAGDNTAPVIAPNVTGTAGSNGWYTSNVSVSWTVTDAESAISTQTGCDPTTLSTDTNGQTLTCSATSAGGTASQSVTIKRDATPPAIVPNAATTSCSVPGTNGWCRGTQTAGFTASDAVSGLANSAQSSFTQQSSTEGTAITIASGTVIDLAGNAAASINAGPFKIDLTPPAVSVTGVSQSATYTLGAVPTAGCTTGDGLSGVTTNAIASTTGGPTGSVTTTCSGAVDNAGNTATSVSVTYTVLSPPPALIINANGTLINKTGAASITGVVTCSSAVSVTVSVSLSQQQTKGKATTAVSGSGSATIACSGTTAWSATVTVSSPAGGKFASGAATATANAPGAAAASQLVQLR